MNQFLIFIVLLWLGSSREVHSVNPFLNWIFGNRAPAPGESSLVLAVETSGRVYLASNEFVKNQMSKIYSKFLFACPFEPGSASSDEYDEYSVTENALSIEKIYERPETFGDKVEFIKHKCKSPVKPSIIHAGPYQADPEVDLYLIGYEVFLDKDAKSYEIDAFNTAALKDEKLAWFNAYTIAFDRRHGNVINVFSPMLAYKSGDTSETISAASTSKQAHGSQQDIFLGNEIFYEEDFNIIETYGIENQKKVFREVQESQKSAFRELFGDSKKIAYVDQIQKRYLGEVRLTPLHTFGIPLMKQTAQTFGNIAPMFNMVYKNAWSNLERHIGFLAKGLKAIHVITGTYGTLRISGVEIYLGPDNRVRVPAAFFKIVSYSPVVSKKYNMLIVTSNNPYDEYDQVNTRICRRNQCKEFGWDLIQQDFYGMGRTTCCELSREILYELKLGHMEQLVDATLDLRFVPHWRTKNFLMDLTSYILYQMIGREDRPVDEFGENIFDQIVGRDGSPPDNSLRFTSARSDSDVVDDELVFSNFISIIYTNYIQPYFSK